MRVVPIFKRPRLTGKVATLNVEVTAADIKQGEPLCARCCPIALAATRAAYMTWSAWGERHTFDAAVSDVLVVYRTDTPVGEYFIAELPREAVNARWSFDSGGGMKPFTFAVEGKLRRGTKQ